MFWLYLHESASIVDQYQWIAFDFDEFQLH